MLIFQKSLIGDTLKKEHDYSSKNKQLFIMSSNAGIYDACVCSEPHTTETLKGHRLKQ